MRSIKSIIIIALLKNRQLFKGKLKREIVDETFSVTNFRDEITKSSTKANQRIPSSFTINSVDIKGMNAEWIVPENAIDSKVILYIHGGGFISGDCISHRLHVTKFAQETGIKALLFDYRLAPEYPFPAALNDCVSAYKWLLVQGYQAKDIVIGGESAGGTLTLTTALALKEQKLPMPAGLFSISPVTDLSCDAESFKTNAKKDIAPMGSWDFWTKMYIGNHDIKDPLLSPYFGNFEGVPPIFITVGTNEIHFDDAKSVAQVAEAYGVEVTLDIWEKMIHAFVIMSPLFPEAKQAMSNIGTFIKKQLS